MALKKINPTTPGQRFRVAPDFSAITRSKPEKSLLLPLRKKGGRNRQGRTTVCGQGGGHKQHVRIIDFKRRKYDVPAKVHAIEYDPIRTAFIALLHYHDGEKRYILAPKDLQVGTHVIAGERVAPEVGNAMPMRSMPLGTTVHNVELHPGKGGAIVRSAGTAAQLTAREGKYVTLKLPSGEVRMVLGTCMATVGTVSNSSHANVVLGKAGRNRWLGRRPKVRGVAMNPHDHANGGGEGKVKGGHLRSANGRLVTGQRTRKRHKYSDRVIIKARYKK